MRRYQDAHKGIRSTHSRRTYFTVDICLKAIAQKASVAFVDLDEADDRCIGIGKGFGRYALRGLCGLHVVDQILPMGPYSTLLKFFRRLK